MEKNIYYIDLFDLYGELLTLKQKEIFTSYYLYDLSLSEIAEPLGKTRQSVYDAVKGVCEKLVQYENILGLHEKNKKLTLLADNCADKNLSEKLREIIGK